MLSIFSEKSAKLGNKSVVVKQTSFYRWDDDSLSKRLFGDYQES